MIEGGDRGWRVQLQHCSMISKNAEIDAGVQRER